MYATRLTLSEKYNYLEDKFKAAYKWLAENDICALDDGAYPVCEGVTANVQSYTTFPASEGYFETHDEYFDIQYLASGIEQFGICNREGLVVREEIPANDLKFYEEPEHSGSILLTPGDFVVVAPEDAHKPRCMEGAPCAVKKVVVKVKI